MIEWLHPAFVLIIGALFVPLFKGKWKQAYLIIPPVAALIIVVLMYTGMFGDIPFSAWRIPFLRYELVFGRVDNLSLLFALIFSIATVPLIIYSLHVKSNSEHMSQLVYAGCALGVVFAGDLISSIFLLGDNVNRIHDCHLEWSDAESAQCRNEIYPLACSWRRNPAGRHSHIYF